MPCRMLVVEDEALVALLVEDVVAGLGCESLVCSTGAAAMAAIREEAGFALAVIDLGLPDMDGGAVVRAFQARWPGAPVVVSTGYGDLAAPVPDQAQDPVLVFAKPWDVDELAAALRRLIG